MQVTRWIEITTKIGCKNNCLYCPQEKLTKNYFKDNKNADVFLSFEKYKTFLSKIPAYLQIGFTGMCEPFENKEALEMLLYTHSQGYQIMVNTTLRGLSTNDIEKIKHIPFLYFSIHVPDIDGLMKFSVDEEFLEKLNLIKKLDIKNYSAITIGNKNPEVEKILGEKYKKHRILLRGNNIKRENIPPQVDVIQVSNPVIEKSLICKRRLYSNENTSPTKIESTILLPDGKIVLCCMDYGLEHVLGNLNDNTYEEIINGEIMQKIENSMINFNSDYLLCRNCEYALEFSQPKWENFLTTGLYQ